MLIHCSTDFVINELHSFHIFEKCLSTGFEMYNFKCILQDARLDKGLFTNAKFDYLFSKQNLL